MHICYKDQQHIIKWKYFIKCIPATSVPQDYCTFFFSNFLMIGLYYSSVNFLLDIIWFLTAPPEVFSSKKLKTIEENSRWYPSNFRFFSVLNVF